MSKKILIVDDEPIIRMDIKNILESKGYTIAEASEGFSAIEKCRSFSPDLVIMDIDIPNLDGIKVSKIISKERLASGIVFLTAHEEDDYLEKAKKVGAFGYIVKPIEEKSFIRNVDMFLSKASEFTELRKDLEDVNRKLNERKLIERAKGILIREENISEDEAYKKIRKICMDTRSTMGEISKVIILGYDE